MEFRECENAFIYLSETKESGSCSFDRATYRKINIADYAIQRKLSILRYRLAVKHSGIESVPAALARVPNYADSREACVRTGASRTFRVPTCR